MTEHVKVLCSSFGVKTYLWKNAIGQVREQARIDSIPGGKIIGNTV